MEEFYNQESTHLKATTTHHTTAWYVTTVRLLLRLNVLSHTSIRARCVVMCVSMCYKIALKTKCLITHKHKGVLCCDVFVDVL